MQARFLKKKRVKEQAVVIKRKRKKGKKEQAVAKISDGEAEA
jgi:hypothetical protein